MPVYKWQNRILQNGKNNQGDGNNRSVPAPHNLVTFWYKNHLYCSECCHQQDQNFEIMPDYRLCMNLIIPGHEICQKNYCYQIDENVDEYKYIVSISAD